MSKRSDRTTITLDARARLSITLALTGSGGDTGLVRHQDVEARRLGMTGAEIDMARAGRSFETRTSHALAVALTSLGSDETLRAALRGQAMRAGIPAAVCDEIEAFVLEHQRGGPHSID